jgi:hypothetical protein
MRCCTGSSSSRTLLVFCPSSRCHHLDCLNCCDCKQIHQPKSSANSTTVCQHVRLHCRCVPQIQTLHDTAIVERRCATASGSNTATGTHGSIVANDATGEATLGILLDCNGSAKARGHVMHKIDILNQRLATNRKQCSCSGCCIVVTAQANQSM